MDKLPITKVYIAFYNEFETTGKGLNKITELITDSLDWIEENATYYYHVTSSELLEYASWGVFFDDNEIIETADGEYFKWFEYENCDPEDFEYRALDLEFNENGEMTTWEIN